MHFSTSNAGLYKFHRTGIGGSLRLTWEFPTQNAIKTMYCLRYENGFALPPCVNLQFTIQTGARAHLTGEEHTLQVRSNIFVGEGARSPRHMGAAILLNFGILLTHITLCAPVAVCVIRVSLAGHFNCRCLSN